MARDAQTDIVAAEPPIVTSIMSMHGGHKESHHDNAGNDAALSPNQVAEAYRATMSEHRMTFSDAVKTHKKALFWSAIMGLVSTDHSRAATQDHYSRITQSIIMESYDQVLIGSFYALPAFQKTFGFRTADGSYQVSASWQSALSRSRL